MSSERLLKAFVTERLTAAAEEIADFFGKTIAKYEEEACESQREITRLRSLLMDLASYRKSEEATPEQNQRELEASPCHVTDVELLHIKKESRAAWGSQQHLVNHALRVHSPETGVVCAVCGDALDSTESLRLHLETHRLPKSCHICGKQCKSTSTMTGHIASHTGEKPHRCHFCGKECRRKGDLKIHMRIHTGEKPFSCSYCCKSFTHSGHLTKHMRNHTGERPHQCSVCGKGFLQSAHLKYHLKTHAEKS
ncbi:zinc finger protein 239-like isoform X3 [Synchiropus splendidus]|uniref:zinc finger protein 239-like isoform X3 n=1 Tax=Synchiropus splendidus TaxID=270530 RepID=UPI00237E8C51|nr:zinc finger protein 239-like isoform X3 [Synchiropus splendidus]